MPEIGTSNYIYFLNFGSTFPINLKKKEKKKKEILFDLYKVLLLPMEK